MNNEIKEILAYFEKYVKITDMHDSEPMLNWKDLKIVLDYITNLQRERDFYKHICLRYGRKGYEELYQEKEDYKSRCEKASEKLGNYKHYSTPTEEQNSENEDIVDSALNILQNGDDDE